MTRLRVVAAGILAVLMLSGCAPADVTAPSTAPVASPSATPTPTPSAPVAPQSILPLACADLFSAEEASALVTEDLAVGIDETLARNAGAIAAQQAGMLSCLWGGEDRTDGGWLTKLEVRILPDADAAFDVGVWKVDDGAIVYPAGSTTSEYLCPYVWVSGSGSDIQCFANVLVDGYWAHADFSRIGGSGGLTLAIAEESMRSIVDRLTERMAQAGPARAAWEPPDDSLRGQVCGGQVADDRDAYEVDLSDPYSVALERTVKPACTLTAVSGADYDVAIVIGGAWAMPTIAQRLEAPGGLIGPPTAVDVPGAGIAVVASGEAHWALVEVGSSVVSVWGHPAQYTEGGGYVSDYVDEFVADVASLVPQILAAG